MQKHLGYFNHIFKVSQLLSVTEKCYRRCFLESLLRSFSILATFLVVLPQPCNQGTVTNKFGLGKKLVRV